VRCSRRRSPKTGQPRRAVTAWASDYPGRHDSSTPTFPLLRSPLPLPLDLLFGHETRAKTCAKTRAPHALIARRSRLDRGPRATGLPGTRSERDRHERSGLDGPSKCRRFARASPRRPPAAHVGLRLGSLPVLDGTERSSRRDRQGHRMTALFRDAVAERAARVGEADGRRKFFVALRTTA